MNILGVTHSSVTFDMPAGACDCHVHVFGPVERFPYSAGRLFTPAPASVEELASLQGWLGLQRVVIVQPSSYGTDNSCTLDALRRLGGRARGVAVIDSAVGDAALREMHAAGVRGVRLNLETYGRHDPVAARELLKATAARVAPLGWHVQVFTNLGVIHALESDIRSLGVPLVVDHFGRADAALGVSQPGFSSLLSLVAGGKVYVKVSAPYRISAKPDYADAAALARALIAANPERMVWGSDWPHPGGRPGEPRRPDVIEPFRAEDDGAALNRLRSWTSGAAQLRQILADNPARLYGF